MTRPCGVAARVFSVFFWSKVQAGGGHAVGIREGNTESEVLAFIINKKFQEIPTHSHSYHARAPN